MITEELDIGGRCERHVGEVFRPRCTDCDREREHLTTRQPRVGFIPGAWCPLHRGYPLETSDGRCARCRRDEESRTS